jgi:hypothetical protein
VAGAVLLPVTGVTVGVVQVTVTTFATAAERSACMLCIHLHTFASTQMYTLPAVLSTSAYAISQQVTGMAWHLTVGGVQVTGMASAAAVEHTTCMRCIERHNLVSNNVLAASCHSPLYGV